MTYAEAVALLAPEERAEITEFVENAPPLSEAQKRVLVAVLAPKLAETEAA